jgi:phosphatidylinositol alpha-1,6-mannosyltransferase
VNPEIDVLGLFPSLDGAAVGGIQHAGREAWRGIVGHNGERRSLALQYAPGASKAGAVIAALRTRVRADTILVWHIHLVKLLPFLRRPTARVAVVLHGVEAWARQDAVTRRLLSRVAMIFCNSGHTWTRFLEHNPDLHALPHRTVHLGLGSPFDGPTPPVAAAPSALMIARLDKGEDYKGHRQMIAAWPRVLERMPDAQLRIVGDGDLRPELEQWARARGAHGSIRFYGRINEATKETLLAESRCLVMPSRGEGFGLVYLEAMRVGRPCLVSTVDSGREVVNPPEAGLAVSREDPNAIADAVISLMTSGAAWTRWSSQARARYEAEFTAGRFHERLLAALFETSRPS